MAIALSTCRKNRELLVDGGIAAHVLPAIPARPQVKRLLFQFPCSRVIYSEKPVPTFSRHVLESF